MVASSAGHGDLAATPERRFPPITAMAVVSMGLIVVGGLYVASYVPKSVPMAPAVILLAASAALLVVNVVTLSRIQSFAWNRFMQVFGWTLLAYAIIAGMIGYVFIADGTRGWVLGVLVGMLLIYAVDIPLLLAFSVARYEDPSAPARAPSGE